MCDLLQESSSNAVISLYMTIDQGKYVLGSRLHCIGCWSIISFTRKNGAVKTIQCFVVM